MFLFSFCKTSRGEIEEKSLISSIAFVETGPMHCLDYSDESPEYTKVCL